MSIEDINNNPKALKTWRKNEKAAYEKHRKDHPDSLILPFESELRSMGFAFCNMNDALKFMPKNKKIIIPVALKYYSLSKQRNNADEQCLILKFFNYKGLDELVPMLISDYYSEKTSGLARWFISDCLYTIRSKNFVEEYIHIVSNSDFGNNRQMIILLLGKLKVEAAIPILIDLLEDEEVRLQAIYALGCFKREEFRTYFERFQNCSQPGWRKYSKLALKKLDN